MDVQVDGWMSGQVGGCMGRWVDVWVGGCMDRWMYSWMDGWFIGWMDRQADRQVDRWRDGWVDGWMGRWMGRQMANSLSGWTDGQTASVKQVWREKDVPLAPPPLQGCPGHSPPRPGPTEPSPAATSAGGCREEEEEAAGGGSSAGPAPTAGSPAGHGVAGEGKFLGEENISSSGSKSWLRSSTPEEMLFLGCPPTLPPNPLNVQIRCRSAPSAHAGSF